MTTISRVGDFTLGWGESLVWDERRDRLYFVDCAAQSLHWLDGGTPPLRSLALPSLPVGLVPTEDGRLVAALDDGLHVVDPDDGSVTLVSPYPAELGGRANDAAADLDGNLVTGTLNLAPAPGSYWWFSARDGWRRLDEGIGNANGPVVMDIGDERTLVFADTHASRIYAYPYDGATGAVGERSVFAETTDLGGLPDGATVDDQGGVWSCLFAAGKIARYASGSHDVVIDTGAELVTDVAFGGEPLDRLYYVSISRMGGYESTSPNAGAVMVVDGTGYRGRPEPRFKL